MLPLLFVDDEDEDEPPNILVTFSTTFEPTALIFDAMPFLAGRRVALRAGAVRFGAAARFGAVRLADERFALRGAAAFLALPLRFADVPERFAALFFAPTLRFADAAGRFAAALRLAPPFFVPPLRFADVTLRFTAAFLAPTLRAALFLPPAFFADDLRDVDLDADFFAPPFFAAERLLLDLDARDLELDLPVDRFFAGMSVSPFESLDVAVRKILARLQRLLY